MTRLTRIAYALQTYSGLLLMLCLAAHGAIAADAPQLTEAVLEVTLSDGEPGEMIVVLRGRDGQLYLEESDFARLRLQLPPSAPYMHEGRRFFDVKAIKGCTVAIDEAAQRAVIAVPATSLDTTHLSAAARRSPDITPASPGAFLNYQLSAQQINGQNIGGAFAELGAFAGAGVVTNTAVARYGNNDNQLVRLDTTYTRDFPASLDTLNLGDAISDGGQLGQRRALRGAALEPQFRPAPRFIDDAAARDLGHRDGAVDRGCVRQQSTGDQQPTAAGALRHRSAADGIRHRRCQRGGARCAGARGSADPILLLERYAARAGLVAILRQSRQDPRQLRPG